MPQASALFVINRKCRICRLAEHDPPARDLVDAWLLGVAPTMESPPIVLGTPASGAQIAKYLNERAVGKRFIYQRQEGNSHRRACLAEFAQEKNQERWLTTNSSRPARPKPQVVGKGRSKAKKAKIRGANEPDIPDMTPVLPAERLVDEKVVDRYIREGMRIIHFIKMTVNKRSKTKEGRDGSIITPSEGAFVHGFGANIDKLMAVRPFIKASTLAGGLPVTVTPSQPIGKGDTGSLPGIQGLVARVRNDPALPAPIPGDGDDDPLENGRGSQILDEEARREADEAARGDDGDMTPFMDATMPDVGVKQGSTAPPLPPLPPPSPPPASAPQLRVVDGGNAPPKPVNHAVPSWPWKPGAREGS